MVRISVNELIDNIGLLLNRSLNHKELAVGEIYYLVIDHYETMILILPNNQFSILGSYDSIFNKYHSTLLPPIFNISELKVYKNSKWL